MRALIAVVALGSAVFSGGPALALNNDDYVSMMGMLWRLREPVCVGLSFDPAVFVKAMKLGVDPEAVRRRHSHAFGNGYESGTELLKDGGAAKFCKQVEDFFDGKHDFYGNVKEVPGPPVPGLTVGD